jgi:hypothetical protein
VWREERSRLAAQIVGLAHDVDGVAQLRQHPLPVGQLDLEDLAHHATSALGLGGQIHVPVLEAAHLEQALGEPAADRAGVDRPGLGDVAARLVRHALVPGGVRRVGPGEPVDGRVVGLARERRGERVVVHPVLERDPTADAPLVDVPPVGPVLVVLAPVGRGAPRRHVADVTAQRVEHVRLDLGQLLGQVGHPGLAALEAQGIAEARIGPDVDPGDPRPAEVVRDAVGLAVGKGGADAVAAGCHAVSWSMSGSTSNWTSRA